MGSFRHRWMMPPWAGSGLPSTMNTTAADWSGGCGPEWSGGATPCAAWRDVLGLES